MYDDKTVEVRAKAFILIAEVRQALHNGVQHFSKVDGRLLESEREILEALVDEGGITFKPVN